MEKAFLRQVASLFAQDNDIQGYTFVFPNRRSSLFFLKHLGELKDKPLFAPRVFTIDNLFDYLSDLEVADDLTLIFRLWKTYTSLQKDYQLKAGVKEADIKEEKADDFISWGKIILSDFTDVDQYMIDARQLFMNVKDINALKSDTSILSERQLNALKKISGLKEITAEKKVVKKYLEIWDMLLPLYESFRESLFSDGIAYSAMLYRSVAEKLKNIAEHPDFDAKLSKLGRVVFIGFSASSECEKELMRYFKKNGGLFYWDYFSDMIKTGHNRSSHLISKCTKEFGNSEKPLSGNGGWEKGRCIFNVIGASGATEQAMIASKLLDMIQEEGVEDIDTAVVVSDETLLLPLLEMLGRENVNVTMGYPLKATSMASLMLSLSDLHIRSRKTSSGIMIPGDVLLSILSHPYIKDIDSTAASKAIDYIKTSNLYMLDESELTGPNPLDINFSTPLSEMLKRLAPTENMFGSADGKDVAAAITDYFRTICKELAGHISSVERSFLNKFLEILDRISSSKIQFQMERSFYSLIRSAIKSSSVSFRGEPLEGLQIMGNLETRALDFDRIIFLSFNEGTYPASGEKSSCVPYFLRKVFNLPTYENENSISAYNFYRLIQRASQVYMIYDTANTDKLKAKEESRFLKQLKYDFEVDLKEMSFDFPLPSSSMALTGSIMLTDKDRDNLGNFFKDLNKSKEKEPRRFSASSLNNYIDCQRKFFFSKILGIRDDEDLTDTVEANTFGSIFHYCMEHIYDNFAGGKGKKLFIDEEVMFKIKKQTLEKGYLDKLISDAFEHEMKVKRIEGQNLIIKKSIEAYIRKAINADCIKAKTPYELTGNEVSVSVELDKDFSSACFTGDIDRLEEYAGLPRICDYKTGRFLKNSSKLSSYLPEKELGDDEFESLLEGMFNTEKHRDKYESIMFQLFVYAFLYKQKSKISSDFYLSVYQLPVIDKTGPVSIRITNSQLEKFSARLAVLLKGIRDKAETPGSSVEVCKQISGNCDYCDFNKYCRRSYSDEK